MKRLTPLFLLIIISYVGLSQEIQLMSYNIGSSHWIETRDSVIARITFNDPDVFCAIEATGNTRPYLEAALTDYNMLQTFGGSPNLSESHIFYRKNMFTVIDSGFVEMDTYGGYTGPRRYVNWARLEEATSQNQFLVYASHFLFVFPTNVDSGTVGQYRHADGMVQLMDMHSSLNIPMITVGDFNADSLKAVMQFLLHQTPLTFNSTTVNNPIVLDDSWYVANPTAQKPGTVGNGMSAIDWILVTPDTRITSAIIDDQGVNPNGTNPSDHLPLMISFDLSEITSSRDASYNTGVLAFPNPFQERIQFEFELNKPERISIQITDISGKVIKQTEASEYDAGKHQLSVDLCGIDDGAYYYILLSSDQFSTGVIIKNSGR